MKFGETVVSVFIVLVIFVMIIPIPPFLLDVLITINLSLALIILLTTMFISKSLDFSVFPSILLITTVYRLALNIASTKLILGSGYAGEVIQTFGSFAIGNNIVVGFIAFLIIIIVQFIVITRGSERVAEVAARFTLDAMPGKQMAIDADLNTGVINDAEAKKRRTDIQREADFYGAMDGASKFVKGDAIASIIITVINIVGGIIIGMLFNKGMDITAILNKYTILTIGDGLVSQIPALLISTATGLVVTRAASESNLGTDVLKQLLSQPKVMYIAAVVLLFFAVIGLPRIPNILMAGLFGYLGYYLNKSVKIKNEKINMDTEKQQADDFKRVENVMPLLKVDPIELEFGYNLIPFADSNQGGDLLDRVVMIRRQCALELGVVVPMVRLRDDILQLNNDEYIIKIRGNKVAGGTIMVDHFLAMNPGNVTEKINGIETTEPAFGVPALWIDNEEREKAESYGYTVVDPPSVIATHLTEIIKSHIYEIITRQDVQTLLDNIKDENKALIDELIPKVLKLGDIQKVLCNLLKERIPIRDMTTILETLSNYAEMTKDTDILTEYVRQALKRTITEIYTSGNKLYGMTLDQKTEKIISDSIKKTEMGTYLSLDPVTLNKIINNTAEGIKKFIAIGQRPVVLTSPIIRSQLKRIYEQSIKDLVVLSYNELLPEVSINVLWKVSIS